MHQRTLEFLSQRKEESPYTRNSPQEKLHYGYRKTYGLENIAKPGSAGRNEDASRQKRNSILSFYVDQRKCQAYVLGKQDEEREENN